ncbi:MAG: 50S ribosomal protein L9 [Legionellales bacterium]|nr:MAG: 50S ribosomal protein L9 [Legionellales bacterium]
MKVILKESVNKLGKLGDIVNVKPGYARNCLIPQGHAVVANDASIEEFNKRKAELEKEAAQRLDVAKQLAEKLATLKLKLSVKSGEAGKLFGSVTTKDVLELFATHEVVLSKGQIRMPEEHIRYTGTHVITIKLHAEVHKDINLEIVSE